MTNYGCFCSTNKNSLIKMLQSIKFKFYVVNTQNLNDANSDMFQCYYINIHTK